MVPIFQIKIGRQTGEYNPDQSGSAGIKYLYFDRFIFMCLKTSCFLNSTGRADFDRVGQQGPYYPEFLG